MTLPILVSCGSSPKRVVPPIVINNKKVTLNCVLPFDDVKKKVALNNFQTDIKSIFPDYNINLSFVKGDTNAYNTKIKVMMYSDTPPDIFYSEDGSFTEELYSSNRIKPVEKLLNDLNYWNKVIPSAKLIGDTGHLYAVPIDETYYNIMLINTEMFSQNNVKIPENFEDLETSVKQFKEKGITPIAMGGKDGASVYKMIEGFAGTMDNGITSKIVSGKSTFSGDIFKQAATSVKQLMELGAFQKKTETISDEEAGNLFYSSKAAIYCTSSDKLDMAYSKLKDKIAVLYYQSPGKTDEPVLKNIISGGAKKDCGLLISAWTNYPTEAVKLAVEISEYYNKYLYEKQGHSVTVYNLDKMEWKTNIARNLGTIELILAVKQEGKVNTGLFQNNISANKEKSIKEASTAFMTGILPVSDYLKEMDIGMKVK